MLPKPRPARPPLGASTPRRLAHRTLVTLVLLLLVGGAALAGARLWVLRSARIYRELDAVPRGEVAIVPGSSFDEARARVLGRALQKLAEISRSAGEAPPEPGAALT
ncbi:hypothetical protein [Sorangium sp. So ce861]|uniref:hypothetical protein n=1 Tax=Sorangium sp. So ce861 TaxID=3133323 RepID=UPI003F626FAC